MERIGRRTALTAIGALGIARPDSVPSARDGSTRSVKLWRYVNERTGIHFGIPTDSGRLVISDMHSDAVTVLNLPRADPSAIGQWVAAPAPSRPFLNPEFRGSDTFDPAAPDEVMAVGWDDLKFLIAVRTPDALPIARMLFFLIRVDAAVNAMQTFAVPPPFYGDVAAIFVRGSSIIVVNQAGDEKALPRS